MRLTRRELALGTVAAAVIPPFQEAEQPAYPDHAFSRPLIDKRPPFETLEGVALLLKPAERAVRFPHQSLTLEDASQARWRFRTTTLLHNALFIQERVRRRPVSISVRMANLSRRPVSVELQAHELTWWPTREPSAAVWVLGSRQILLPQQERNLVFRMDDAVSNAQRPLRLPITALLLVLADLDEDTDYDIRLSDLVVHYPQAPGVRATELACTTEHSRARFTVGVTFTGTVSEELALEVRQHDRVYWRVCLSDEELHASQTGLVHVERDIPWYLPDGRYEVGLTCNGYRVEGPTCLLEHTASSRPVRTGVTRLPIVRRRLHRGRPSVFVNNRPFVWQGYATYEYVPGSLNEFGRSGVTCFCVPVAAGRHMYQISQQTWLSPSGFDFAQLDEHVCASLQANPHAMITLRVSLAMPHWWLERHTQELVRMQTDEGLVEWEEGGALRVASLASRQWRRDQTTALRALLHHCMRQRWASRLIAVWLGGGTTEEWFHWGSNDGEFCDYSAPMTKAYTTNTGEPAIPSRRQRQAPGWDVYPDTDDGRKAARYHSFLSELTAETICHFARVVKEETRGRTLVGCFYGYVVQLAGEPRQALSGHFALRKLIQDPHVDLLAGVPLHDFRDLTRGYNPYCSATESILAAGKLLCNENDLFSWLHPLHWHVLYDPADPRAGAISMHARECANDAVHGVLAQKFSLAASWHHDRQLQEAFAHQYRVYAEAQQYDRSPVEEVAFLVDDTSLGWTPPESPYLATAHKHLLQQLGRTGAPVGVWLLTDLDQLPRRIRFVVVASSYAARGEDLVKLERALQRGGRTYWVIGAPGLIDVERGRWMPSRPARLLQMPIRVREEEASGIIVRTDIGSALPGVAHVRPRAEAEGAGFLRYQDGVCAGLTRSLRNGGRLIWTGVPVADSAILREWLMAAGVHLYAPIGCFVHASRELVAVTAPESGEIPISWPRPARIRDLLDGWSAAGLTTMCPFKAGQTRLFHVSLLPRVP